MVKVLPMPSLLTTDMLPPHSSSVVRAKCSPSPVPSPGGLVVKNGSKIWSKFSSDMPLPVSEQESQTLLFDIPVVKVISFSISIASAALIIKFISTCCI